jgi:hypothetical protein
VFPSQTTAPFQSSLTLTYLATIDTSLLPLSLTGAGSTLQLRSTCSRTRTSLAKLFISRQNSGILLAVNESDRQNGEEVDVGQKPDQILIYPVFSTSPSSNATTGPTCGLLTPLVTQISNQKGIVQIFALPLSLKSLLSAPESFPDEDDKARFLLASPTKPSQSNGNSDAHGKKRTSMGSILDNFDVQKKRKLTPAPSTKAIPSLRTGPPVLPSLSRKPSLASLNIPVIPVDDEVKSRRAMISKAVLKSMQKRGLKMESRPGRKDSDIAHAREVHMMVINCVELSFVSSLCFFLLSSILTVSSTSKISIASKKMRYFDQPTTSSKVSRKGPKHGYQNHGRRLSVWKAKLQKLSLRLKSERSNLKTLRIAPTIILKSRFGS